MDTYTIAEGLTVPQNTVKAALFNGSKIIKRAINSGAFDSVLKDHDATIAKVRELVANQLQHVAENVTGDHENKADLMYRLELYLINKMLDNA